MSHKSPRRIGLEGDGGDVLYFKKETLLHGSAKGTKGDKGLRKEQGSELTRAAEKTHNEEKLINAQACHRTPGGRGGRA